MIRLFIAVTVPSEVLEACAEERRRIEEALGKLARALRFPRPEGLHFTLKFLGWSPEDSVEPIKAALGRAAAQSAPFDVALGGLQAFPTIRRPRVVFLDVTEGGEPMSKLAALVEDEVSPLGFPTEKRGFTAHLTMARVSDPKAASRVGEAVAALPPVPVGRFQATKVSLMQSELSPGGSRYTELAGIPLDR